MSFLSNVKNLTFSLFFRHSKYRQILLFLFLLRDSSGLYRLRMKAFRNFFPAAKKLPRKVARRLSVFFCLPLRSPPGAAELAPLKQSSPYFRLLPRSRQPDKGGHFSSPTLPAIKGEAATHLSFRMNMRNPMLFVWDSSFHCVPFRMTFDCHSERGYQPTRNPLLICDNGDRTLGL